MTTYDRDAIPVFRGPYFDALVLFGLLRSSGVVVGLGTQSPSPAIPRTDISSTVWVSRTDYRDSVRELLLQMGYERHLTPAGNQRGSPTPAKSPSFGTDLEYRRLSLQLATHETWTAIAWATFTYPFLPAPFAGRGERLRGALASMEAASKQDATRIEDLPPRFVLLCRSFRYFRRWGSRDVQGDDFYSIHRIERTVDEAALLALRAPVLTLADPWEPYPRPIALSLPENEVWLPNIKHVAARAHRLVFLIPELTPGVLLELELVANNGWQAKTVLIVERKVLEANRRLLMRVAPCIGVCFGAGEHSGNRLMVSDFMRVLEQPFRGYALDSCLARAVMPRHERRQALHRRVALFLLRFGTGLLCASVLSSFVGTGSVSNVLYGCVLATFILFWSLVMPWAGGAPLNARTR